MIREAWVLQLKPEVAIEQYEGKTLFLTDDDEIDFLTENLQKAELIFDKEGEIERQKAHEKIITDRYGLDSVCNFGYTNISKNFEWVPVEVEVKE
ncbi:hypothetical protein NST02_17960 [Robertmurraya sp. FSL W8-0741]|uniref:hypothetical protein n=1 Tax=Robertmurraya sp. FSL W8-0741 TaxID=2954629 RepID=UPI0030FB4D75